MLSRNPTRSRKITTFAAKPVVVTGQTRVIMVRSSQVAGSSVAKPFPTSFMVLVLGRHWWNKAHVASGQQVAGEFASRPRSQDIPEWHKHGGLVLFHCFKLLTGGF